MEKMILKNLVVILRMMTKLKMKKALTKKTKKTNRHPKEPSHQY
jgi:hypothetical protein